MSSGWVFWWHSRRRVTRRRDTIPGLGLRSSGGWSCGSVSGQPVGRPRTRRYPTMVVLINFLAMKRSLTVNRVSEGRVQGKSVAELSDLVDALLLPLARRLGMGRKRLFQFFPPSERGPTSARLALFHSFAHGGRRPGTGKRGTGKPFGRIPNEPFGSPAHIPDDQV